MLPHFLLLQPHCSALPQEVWDFSDLVLFEIGVEYVSNTWKRRPNIPEVCLIYPPLRVVFLYHFEGDNKLRAPQGLAPCSNIWHHVQVMSSHTLVQPAIPLLLFSSPSPPPPQSIHSSPSQLLPFPVHPPPPGTPPLPTLLNSVDGRPRTLTVFSHATRQCWPLPMRKWFRTWTRTSSRDSPLSTQSSQEMLLLPLPPSRLDFSSCTDTWNHIHKHIHDHSPQYQSCVHWNTHTHTHISVIYPGNDLCRHRNQDQHTQYHIFVVHTAAT